MKHPLLLPPALLALILLAGCGREDATPAPPGPRAVPVTTATAQAATVVETATAVGRLDSKSRPRLEAEVAGRITSVVVDVGDRVAAGDRLALLDPTDLRLEQQRAQAELAQLRSDRDHQQRQLERLLGLAERELASTAQLDEARSRLNALNAQVSAARARLQLAERNLGRAEIVSPVDGEIEARLISTGDRVAPGTPLFTLSTDHLLQATLPFSERHLTRLRPGLPVRLTSPVTPGQEVVHPLSEIRPVIAPGSRAVEVIVEFPSPGGWPPGASVDGVVELERRDDAILVPALSVIQRPAGRVVYVVEGETAHQRVVEIGLRVDHQYEIRSGLAAGEVVVLDGAGFLTDGARIAVRSDGAR